MKLTIWCKFILAQRLFAGISHAALILLLACVSPLASAQSNFPDRPLTLIIPFAPGSAIENVGRVIARGMSKELGQPITVVNQPGAATKVGTEAFLRAPNDGYTLLLLVPANAVNLPALLEQPSFDTLRDMTPLSKIVNISYTLVMNPKVPATTLPELIAYAKANPGKLTFGSSGLASATHLLFESFMHSAGIKLTHVPYKGEPLALNDMLGGHVDMTFATETAKQFVDAGKLRALATPGATRYAPFKDVPTFQEVGVVGDLTPIWVGLATAKGVPQPVLDKTWQALTAAIKDEAVRKPLMAAGFNMVSQRPQEFEADIRKETAAIRELGKRINLKLQ